MELRRLISMNDFVNQTLAYVYESHNYERGMAIIKWYSNLINQPISFDMFQGEKPLFPNFHIVDSQKEAYDMRYKNSIFRFGEKEYGMTLQRAQVK
jgi:hypothetical protein